MENAKIQILTWIVVKSKRSPLFDSTTTTLSIDPMGLEQGLEAKVCVALSHPKGWPTSGTIRVLTRPKKGHIFRPKSHFEGMAENHRKSLI